MYSNIHLGGDNLILSVGGGEANFLGTDYLFQHLYVNRAFCIVEYYNKYKKYTKYLKQV